MILAEKIMLLRKKSGWSQEELAAHLEISRQSVSKWESGASLPDLDKIIKMSSIFGVSTDYLLKDELEEITFSQTDDTPQEIHSVSVEEANEYITETRAFAQRLAPAVAVCILAVIPTLLLAGISEYGIFSLPEGLAASVGVGILLIMVAIAVGVMVVSGLRMDKYAYIEEEIISMQYGVRGIVDKKKTDYEKTFYTCIGVGVVSCILGVVPLIVTSGLIEDGFPLIICVCVLLAMVAFAVYFFVRAGIIYDGFKKLLQEGDYTEDKKLLNQEFKRTMGFVPGVYWCIVTAIYLSISFLWSNWNVSWIVWPIAAALFVALIGILKGITAKKMRAQCEK